MKKAIIIIGSLSVLGAGAFFTYRWYKKSQDKVNSDSAALLAKAAGEMVNKAIETAKAAKATGVVWMEAMATNLYATKEEMSELSTIAREGGVKAMNYATSVDKISGMGLISVGQNTANELYKTYNDARAAGKTHDESLVAVKEYIKSKWNQ